MDKKLAGLLGAAAALTTMTAVQAATPEQKAEMAPATSYRDLLDPVPNALSALKADDAKRNEAPKTELAQVSVQVGGGHHHYHHHHHHHHHHGVILRVGPGHHHYHHHHHHHHYHD
jgi:hypothetical protein